MIIPTFEVKRNYRVVETLAPTLAPVFHFDVIIGKTIEKTFRAGVFKQDRTRLTDKAIVKIMEFTVADGQESLAALVLLLGTDNMRNAEGGCARTLAIAEHMELRDGQRLNEALSLVKQLGCLAASAHNDIDADESIRH